MVSIETDVPSCSVERRRARPCRGHSGHHRRQGPATIQLPVLEYRIVPVEPYRYLTNVLRQVDHREELRNDNQGEDRPCEHGPHDKIRSSRRFSHTCIKLLAPDALMPKLRQREGPDVLRGIGRRVGGV